MTEDTFWELSCILDIKIDEMQSRRSTSNKAEPITSTMIVMISLHYLAGDTVSSLNDIFGPSTDYINQCINKFLDAVDFCNHPMLTCDLLPKTPDELKKSADKWVKKSSAFMLFYGTVGAIDGFLQTTQKPKGVPNPTDYRSGHYNKFGINVQAICDVRLWFIYLSTAAPGGKMTPVLFSGWTTFKNGSKVLVCNTTFWATTHILLAST